LEFEIYSRSAHVAQALDAAGALAPRVEFDAWNLGFQRFRERLPMAYGKSSPINLNEYK